MCNEAGLSDLHFHDLRRTAARNMRRGHVSEKVAMEVGGWKTTSVFHRYAIVDNQDVADAMNMLERAKTNRGNDWRRRPLQTRVNHRAMISRERVLRNQKCRRLSPTAPLEHHVYITLRYPERFSGSCTAEPGEQLTR